MSSVPGLDAQYEIFVASLEPELRATAEGLAATLGLAPARVPWSEVFGHAVTLGAPAMVVGASEVAPAARSDALRAHLLAVIEAFASDRIADGQAQATPELTRVLHQMRRERNAALMRVAPDLDDDLADFDLAARRTREAIAIEREILQTGEAVSFGRYLEISLGKQQLGVPASIALAYAAGWDERKRRAVARLLVGVWLGLQLHDDVVDWQDDLQHGGAWALAVARGIGLQEDTQPVTHRRIVEGSGALVRMLVASSRYFADARRLARVVGAGELEAWAATREAQVRDLSLREASSPGFTVRAHKLAPWAKVIFS